MTDDRSHDDPDRLDFTSLDPRADAAHFERLVRDVRRAATPELVRRQAGPTLWDQIARWRRPVIAASGLVALVSVVILAVPRPTTTTLTTTTTTTTATTTTTLAEAVGVPSQVARWVQANERPTPGDLLGLDRSKQ